MRVNLEDLELNELDSFAKYDMMLELHHFLLLLFKDNENSEVEDQKYIMNIIFKTLLHLTANNEQRLCMLQSWLTNFGTVYTNARTHTHTGPLRHVGLYGSGST